MKIRYYIAMFAVAFGAAANSVRGDSATAEDKLLEVLKSGATVGDKANACRGLKLAGTEKSIPALASLLADAELSHPARFALESMPIPAAGAALRDALGKATGLARCGIIDSLGQRRDPMAVPLIAPDLASKDLVLVAAAATALGKIGTFEAAALLTKAQAAAPCPALTKIDDGLLTCAERLRLAGKYDEALDVYVGLYAPDKSRLIRAGARRGVMQMYIARQREPAREVARWLAKEDPMIRAAAAGELSTLSDADLGTIAGDMAKLPQASQVSVLAAIGIRGHVALAPAVLAAVKSPHESVRLAAARALCTVGDVTALPALVELAAEEGPVGQVAWQGLEVLSGPKIDEQIFEVLRTEKDLLRRATWIRVLEVRRPAGVVPVLLVEAASREPVVATPALAALAKLAGPRDIPALVAIARKSEYGSLRDDAERAIRQICLQIADAGKRAQPVLDIYQAARPADRIAFLPLLGCIGGEQVRPLVRAALESKDPAVYEAGVRAISNWPDAGAADQLLGLAQTAKLPVHRQWALRAFVRVVSLPGGASTAQKLARLMQAMQLSKTDGEQLWVIQRAAAVRSVETLRFIAPYMDRPALAERACRSVVELAHHKELRNPNIAEFTPALEKVLKISKNTTTRERAKRYLQGN